VRAQLRAKLREKVKKFLVKALTYIDLFILYHIVEEGMINFNLEVRR
jgi:hypothetical protein